MGFSNDTALYFDGGSWAEIPLSLTATRGNVRFEAVEALPDGIVLTGQDTGDAGNHKIAVVNTYRFGP